MAVHRPRAFLDVSIGNEPAGRLVIELFVDKTPKTCENFRVLCEGSDPSLSYALSPFHRIIDEFMIQGGDITKGDGTGGRSIYGGEFEDENLGWREIDAPGLVCMANRGKGTNSSQFFITLEACAHLNNKHTVFGHLVAGHDTLSRLAKVPVDSDDRPLDAVLISRSGELTRKPKTTTTTAQPTTTSDSHRGRPRHHTASPSHSPSHSRSRSPPRRLKLKERRNSDQVVDETLRGRPKRRSESRSASRSSHTLESGSPTYKHKRKRSASPSRGADGGGGEDERKSRASSAEHRRRRRSLPNQYHGDRYDRRVDGESKNGDRRGGGRDGFKQREQRWEGRRDPYPRYQGRGSRDGRLDDGRLSGNNAGQGGEGESGIKFKGRGSMKYREPDRKW